MISDIKIMRGPNKWSYEHHKLLAIKLDPAAVGQLDVSQLVSSVNGLLSGFCTHRALQKDSGILTLAHLFSTLVFSLQADSAKKIGFYDTVQVSADSIFALVEYEDEDHALAAVDGARALIMSLGQGQETDLEELRDDLGREYRYSLEGPSTAEIIRAAQERNIPIKRVGAKRQLVMGYGKFRQRIQAAITDQTSTIAINLAGNKDLTKTLLAEAMLPVPAGMVISDEKNLERVVERIGYPLVTKPLDGHQGKCITTDITKFESLVKGFNLAKTYSRRVVIEKYISGDDYRFLVINYKVAAVARRSPALVVGDGKLTIRELIEKVNADPSRKEGHGGVLTKIKADEITELLLKESQRTLDSVLPEGEVQILKDTANLSTGGTAEDLTDVTHPANISLAERAARVIGLDVCGIDIMAPDITTPVSENGGAIIEVNAAPGLRMHIAPSAGKARPVGKAVIDMLFPEGDGRIPIIAITGTNGKTTTSRLMAHVMQSAGFRTGFTTTEGIYINGEQVVSGDCSGPRSAATVLNDPLVDAAVLECARGGILRSGLPFDACDIGIVTNVAADHLGLQDINTVEDMARVKSVVPHAVRKEGLAILNASIDLVRDMAKGLSCRVAYFSLEENETIRQHCKSGGLASVLDADGFLTILDGKDRIKLLKASDIPITLGGRAQFMTENVMPVALSAYFMKLPVDKTVEALMSFHPTSEQAPGRLNIFEMDGVNVVIDYAHNPHGMKAFSQFVKNIKERKTGIITGVGDRRDEDLIEMGQLAGDMYDEIIIRIDSDTRGRSPESIVDLLTQGIRSRNAAVPIQLIPDPREALLAALKQAEKGSYIVLNPEYAQKMIELVKSVKQELEGQPQ